MPRGQLVDQAACEVRRRLIEPRACRADVRVSRADCPSPGSVTERDERSTAARHALPRQHRRHPVGERAGAAAEGRRRAARRLRARAAPPRGRLVARPPRRPRRAGSRRSSRAFARLAPQTDVFHFYFGLTLIPKSLQFPLLRAAAARRASSTTSAPTSAARRRRSSRTASAPTPRSSAPTTRSAGCPRRT